MKTTRDMLIEARALVEKGWCQGYQAKDETGACVSHESAKARSFCAYGACWRAEGTVSGPASMALRRAFGSLGVGTWNDAPDRTQADVLALFDRAIAAEPAP